MSNVARRSQPAYSSGVFEVTEEIASTLVAQSGFRTVHSGLNCAGIDGQSALEHPILLSAYSGLGVGLSVSEMYALKCKVIAPNNAQPPHFIHEMSHHIHVGNSETFPGNLVDNTSISSIGVITERRTLIEKPYGGKPTTVCIVRHTDWDPTTSANVEFNIEYWCRPVRNLIKTQNLFQRGREVSLTGFITGRDRSRHLLQVDVYSVSVATGHENINSPSPGGATGQSRTTRAGQIRLPRPDEQGTAYEPPSSSPTESTRTAAISESHFLPFVEASGSSAVPTPVDSPEQPINAGSLVGILQELDPAGASTDANGNVRQSARASANSNGKRPRGIGL
ncbi:uncharacterized protein MELLADRAFT_69303 [Melampsora larici-populina 98AG31]|uniref:Uncharacterized protein n=1 Tax=Melampsora larici-populina (strain 98AG31 / pathotype 3-4-7) TaxID=747676 RepID=F4SA78_MELLP|nr:uncharacterized protein MELLADRAFT_69303 [Melampsora larici-populina 98AG31]EGF98453.1 hypothetical protein MELLADRAFT_69303 [Melampsora larici-populina 98AG31]